MSALTVRVVTPADRVLVPLLEELEREAFGRGALNVWGLVPMIEHGRVVVGEIDGELVAWAILFRPWQPPSKEAYMFSLAVRVDRRRQGIGTRFLEDLLSLLATEGVGRVVLTVSPLNLPALRLYQGRFGFERARVYPACYGEGEDRFVLVKDLTPAPQATEAG